MPELKIGGVVIEDYSHVEALEDGGTDLSEWSERRVAVEVNIALNKRFEMVLDLAYDTEADDFNWRDAYLAVDLPKKMSLQIGKMKQNFGISRTSSLKNLLTMERPLALDVLQLDRTNGVLLARRGDRLFSELGYFRDRAETGEPIDSYLMRHVYLLEDTDYRHFGVSFARERFHGSNYRVRSQAEINVGESLLRTEKIRAEAVDYWGVDFAWQRERVAVISELLGNRVRSPLEGDRDYVGGYVQGSWFLTPDRLSFADGQLKSMKPVSAIALELTGTLGFADIHSAGDGYRASTQTMAFNTYYRNHWKIMAELNRLEVLEGNFAGQDRLSLMLRLQYRF